jgi:hypothetical protein
LRRLKSTMSLQHPDYTEVFIQLRPMDAHRHQFKMLTRGGFSLQQSWILPCCRTGVAFVADELVVTLVDGRTRIH